MLYARIVITKNECMTDFKGFFRSVQILGDRTGIENLLAEGR